MLPTQNSPILLSPSTFSQNVKQHMSSTKHGKDATGAIYSTGLSSLPQSETRVTAWGSRQYAYMPLNEPQKAAVALSLQMGSALVSSPKGLLQCKKIVKRDPSFIITKGHNGTIFERTRGCEADGVKLETLRKLSKHTNSFSPQMLIMISENKATLYNKETHMVDTSGNIVAKSTQATQAAPVPTASAPAPTAPAPTASAPIYENIDALLPRQ